MLRRLCSLLTLAVAIAAAAASACSSASDVAPCSEEIQPFKELVIVDDAIVGDVRATNKSGGAWSFRHLIENMVPAGSDPGDFVLAWLEEWASRKDFNGFALDREPRDAVMMSRVICPWLKRSSPTNGCDDTCTQCTTRKLDLASSPFRTIAITNRMDLADRPDASGPSGEGRFIFALTDGAADDAASQPAPMTIAFEYALPKTLSSGEWAHAWHALGLHASFDAAYANDLEAITDRFTARDVSPEKPNGSALAQVRTNESALNWIWQLRQFSIVDGRLELGALADTPAESFNNSQALADLVSKNVEKIRADQFVVPQGMLPGSIDSFSFEWTVPNASESTRLAYARTTCNGCHSTTPSVDTAFHISPFRTGVDRVSKFLYDRAGPGAGPSTSTNNVDELSKRATKLQARICAD